MELTFDEQQRLQAALESISSQLMGAHWALEDQWPSLRAKIQQICPNLFIVEDDDILTSAYVVGRLGIEGGQIFLVHEPIPRTLPDLLESQPGVESLSGDGPWWDDVRQLIPAIEENARKLADYLSPLIRHEEARQEAAETEERETEQQRLRGKYSSEEHSRAILNAVNNVPPEEPERFRISDFFGSLALAVFLFFLLALGIRDC